MVFPFTVAVQVVFVPVQAPAHPPKTELLFGLTVMVTTVPGFKTSEQSLPQVIPVPETVPVPPPCLITVIVACDGLALE